MEEVIVIFLQVFFELGLQLFASGLVDGISFGKHNDGCAMFGIHMFLGGGLGWLSTLIFPNLLLPHIALQITNLVFAPIFAGAISTWIVCAMTKQESHKNAFWHGFLFALMFGLARFGFGNH
ncbi:hypothetical protein BH11PLA2_BH11PLA2_11380 [soil metagenome]